MTSPSPRTSCRLLASLWPAPAAFAAIAPDGAPLAGDAGLAARAAAALAAAGPGVSVVHDGALLVVRRSSRGPATAAEVPGAVLPALLEADLLRVTSGAA